MNTTRMLCVLLAASYSPAVLAGEGAPPPSSDAPAAAVASMPEAPAAAAAAAPAEMAPVPPPAAPAPSAPAPTPEATPTPTVARKSTAPANPAAGLPSEAGLPAVLNGAPPTIAPGFEWHGNIELDVGQVGYSWNQDSMRDEKVYDSRGRFVFGPMLTRQLGGGHFLRITGQAVAWVREDYNIYQINADDVYVQVGRSGRWDLQAGRFLTWRVFRKGLGFDLYTLEDTGTRTQPNFTDSSGWFPHMYEVNTIFMRDSFGQNVPAGRAAFHYYPTSWSGIEAVVDYGRLMSGGNAIGGRLAAAINQRFFSLLGGAEYMHWQPAQQLPDPNAPAGGSFVACGSCGKVNTKGLGGSASFTPVKWLEATGSWARSWYESWDGTTNRYIKRDTLTWGGYLQVDLGSVLFRRSLYLGGSYFRTELTNSDYLYQLHHQYAGYLAYPLGFDNAVLKLVVSMADGHQDRLTDPVLESDMLSVRLRYAMYF